MISKSKIRIAHVVYDLRIGGVTNVINRLMKERVEAVDLALIILTETHPAPAKPKGVKIYQLAATLPNIYSLKGFFKIYINPKKYFGSLVNELASIQKDESFDIFHFHGIPRDLPVGMLLKRRFNNLKLVYTDHLLRISDGEYSWLKSRLLSFIYKKFYYQFNTIFVSQAIADAARSFGFINPARQNRTIENSINAAASKRKTDYVLSAKTSIVYVSRISAVKGHFVLPAVAELLIHKHQFRNFEFVLIGPGELADKLKAEIKARDLDNYFRIQGPMQNIPDMLPAFDMAVFPSEREGLPVALLEKMAAGLPVVASDIPEIKNVIQHPDEALLFPVNDPEACAAQLMRLVQDQSLRERTGAAARKAVEERYAEPLATRYAAFYNSLF